MDTKWLRLQCHSRHLARSLIEFWKFWVVDRIPTRINLSNFQIKEMKKSCLQILPAWARHPGIPHLWGPGDKAALQHPSVAAHDASDSLEHVERRNVTNFPSDSHWSNFHWFLRAHKSPKSIYYKLWCFLLSMKQQLLLHCTSPSTPSSGYQILSSFNI